VPVRVIEDPPPRPQAAASSCREQLTRSGVTMELVLRNGRVLLVSEAIPSEVLGRLAATPDG
jgi:hypothetical protein